MGQALTEVGILLFIDKETDPKVICPRPYSQHMGEPMYYFDNYFESPAVMVSKL